MLVPVALNFILMTGSLAIHLEMISILPSSIPVGPALPFTGSALTLAAEMVNRTYAPHITISLKLIFNTSHKSCEDADADNLGLLGQYYYQRTSEGPKDLCMAVVGSGCGGLYEAANLGTEWNMLIFSDGLVVRDAFNNRRQPTAVSLGGAFDSYAMVLMKILEQNGWTHVSVFCDIGTGVTFHDFLTNAMTKLAAASSIMGAVEPTRFDGRNTTNVLPVVIFILAHTIRAKIMLEMARKENMTNSEYVYFIVQPLEQDQYGRVTLFSNASDQMAEAYATVIYITARNSGENMAALNRELAARTPPRNGIPVYNNATQPLDNFSVRATYDSIALFAKVVNETSNPQVPHHFDCSGRLLANMMSNRTVLLDTGESFVSPDGTRNLDLDIYGYDTSTRVMKPLMWYDSVRNTLAPYPDFRKDGTVHSPLIYPPSNEPECGFNGSSGPCAEVTSRLVTILPAICAVLLMGFLSICSARSFRKAGSRNDKWWLIPSDDVHIQATRHEPTKEACKAELNDKIVWIRPVEISTSFDIESLLGCPVLHQLRGIHHPNVNTFLGICFHPCKASVYLVSQHCPRSSLVELQKHTTLDWDFTFSLLSDLIKGLSYIHLSSVRYHGNLSIRKCLIDGRFVLKIGALRDNIIAHFLNTDLRGYSLKERQVSAGLGKARPTVENRQKDDIWSLGKISLELLGQIGNDPARVTPKFLRLEKFLLDCVSERVKQRPTIRVVDKAFNAYSRSSSKKDIMALVLKRVENYTEDLEEAVALKTVELLNEQQKADVLLREMLPPSVVDKLRNKIMIEPEYFEAVTISFSDLPGFVTWVVAATPYDVIELLNTIYSVFDKEISNHYMVQKIETVGDCYMVASGVPVRIGNDHAEAVCRLAQSLQKAFQNSKLADKKLMLRIGIHSDHCAASVIGRKVPRYCLFGDAVNTASRMQSHGEGGKVHLSYKTRAFLTESDGLACERRGLIAVKGKGEMETFWLCLS